MHGPYEDAIIAICKLIEKAMDGQDAATKAKLWQMHCEDLEKWRAFWKSVANLFVDESDPKQSK